MILAKSFYEWRQPRRTGWSLVWLGLGCVGFYLTPVWLLVKLISLSMGLTFFGLFPIASRYPRYRLLASPPKWLFWDIPTHGIRCRNFLLNRGRTYTDDCLAEWAIARLQVQGRSQAHNDPDVDNKDSSVHGFYTCSSSNHAGRLVVTSKGVRFEAFGGSQHQWELAFNRMNRVEKVSKEVSYSCARLSHVDLPMMMISCR